MENMRDEMKGLVELLRSKAPGDKEKALVLAYQNGISDHKRIVEMGNRDDDTKKTA